MERWDNYYSSRQLLALAVLSELVRGLVARAGQRPESGLAVALQTALALTVDKVADLGNAVCVWEPVAECPRHLFARQAIPMAWDFAEGVPPGDSSGSWAIMVERFAQTIEGVGHDWLEAVPQQASATRHPLADDMASALITDPPYYYSVQYADLSDFFYVWLRRTLGESHPTLLSARDHCPVAGRRARN